MTPSPSGLKALRTIYRRRADAPRTTDVSYLIYATLLVLLVVGFPVTRTLVILLSPPEILTLIRAPTAEFVVSLSGGAILVFLVAFGSVRGPVLLSPFFVTLLADTATRRSRSLSRSFTNASIVVLAVLLYFGIIVSAVRVFGGGHPPVAGIEFSIACLLFALFADALWLWGQALGHRAWILAVGLAALIVGSAIVTPALTFTPWGWVGIAWGGDPTGSALALAALAILVIGSLLSLPAALNSLSRETLLDQAQGWQAASAAAITGDIATALGRFRAVPKMGRRWKAVGHRQVWLRGPWVRFLRSDAVGAIRTPVRLLGGLVTLIAGFLLLSISLVPGLTPGWLLGAIAAGAVYAGCGVLVDGFRYCAIAAGTPPLYPYSVAQQYALHTTFPLLSTLTAALGGFWLGMWFGVPAHALVVCLLIGALAVMARAFDSAKGPPPLILVSSPVPTPAGDPTILFLFAWQADAILIVTASAGMIVSLVADGSIIAVAVISVVVTTGLVLLLQRRLRVS